MCTTQFYYDRFILYTYYKMYKCIQYLLDINIYYLLVFFIIIIC